MNWIRQKFVEITANYSRTKMNILIKLIKNQCKNKTLFRKFYIAQWERNQNIHAADFTDHMEIDEQWKNL